jgi:DNA-binding transcriptional ArsR family regulator
MKKFESLTALIGEPVRARILWSLLDGRAYTSTELCIRNDITAQSASMHLSKLVQADLLTVEKQGRHKYYKFSRPEVAYAIESLASLLPKSEPMEPNPRLTSEMHFCRTCYDHLAGKVAVDIHDKLLKRRVILLEGKKYSVSRSGIVWFENLGIDLESLQNQKRIFARPCLDWSERKYHLAGALGAELLNKMVEFHWVKSVGNSRAMVVTNQGRDAIYSNFALSI